jgi:2Fe-2S ferredoxin
MIKIRLHGPSAGEQRDIAGKPGQSLMEAAVKAGIEGIEADCGGMLTCATCHVYVREPFAALLPLPTDDEAGMLDFTASPRRANSRLSCQIKLEAGIDGIEVDLPASQH